MKAIAIQKHPHNFLFDLVAEKIFKVAKSESVVRVNSVFASKQLAIAQISEPESEEHFSNAEFLSAIVHELKTPLNAIIGFADVLSDEIANPSSQKDALSCVAEIKQAASDMNELIHDILDVAQNSSGNFSVDLSQAIDLRDVLKRAVRLNYDYSLRRNVSLKLEIAEDVNAAKLDAKRMKQVLTNLISNAVKYSTTQSEVKIICKYSAEFLEISVIDQGFGMTKTQIKTAFEKYQTIQNPNSGKVDSFGLGLPITKQLVELQNGAIEVTSEVGKGTQMKIDTVS